MLCYVTMVYGVFYGQFFLIKCVFLQEKKSATPPPSLRRAGSSVNSTEDVPNSTNSKATLHQQSQSSNPTFNCSTSLSVNLPGKLGILTKVILFVLNSLHFLLRFEAITS